MHPQLCPESTLNKNYNPLDIDTVDEDEYTMSRTSEVLHCIAALEKGGKPCFLPFLTHSFEEVSFFFKVIVFDDVYVLNN